MAREAALAVGFGAAAGLLFLSLLSGSPLAMVLVNLTQLPLFLAGLMLGPHAAAIAGAAGALGTLTATSINGALFFALGYAAPVVLVSWQALRWRADATGTVWWYPPGRLVAWLVGVALASIGVGAVLTLGHEGGYEGAVRAVLDEQLAAFMGAGDRNAQMATAMAAIFPGIGAATWMFLTAANGALAQRLLVWWRKNLRPTPDMVEIELPRWIGLAFIVALAVALLLTGTPAYLGRNALPIFALAFFVAGLAVVHAAARRFSAPGPILGLIYVLILLERVENLGQMGQVVKVRPGFARNYLLPQKKALRATKENLAYFEKQRTQLEAQNLKRKGEAEEVAKKLDGLSVVLVRQAGESGQLYGSVSARDVADAITAAGFTVEKRQVILDKQLKTLGLHKLRVSLHPEVSVAVTVNIAQSEEEAEMQAKGIDPTRLAEQREAEAAAPAAGGEAA